MKIRVHFTLPDGTEDSIVLSGSLEDLQRRAPEEVEKRGGKDPWSDILDE